MDLKRLQKSIYMYNIHNRKKCSTYSVGQFVGQLSNGENTKTKPIKKLKQSQFQTKDELK